MTSQAARRHNEARMFRAWCEAHRVTAQTVLRRCVMAATGVMVEVAVRVHGGGGE